MQPDQCLTDHPQALITLNQCHNSDIEHLADKNHSLTCLVTAVLMPASTEFVALCRSQLSLIAEGLGAISCAVYLAEEFADVSRRHLIPIACYPESSYPESTYSEAGYHPLALGMALEGMAPESTQGLSPSSTSNPSTNPSQLTPINQNSTPQDGLVIPLIHNDLVLGVLVARRSERDWTTTERERLTQISHTLALACVLDQRHQWLLQSGYQQRSFLTRQYDTLANLLHQIRNPLTTVRTLAKLMFKRQPAGTREQELIAGILQESEHLQQLLQQFDHTIDIGEAILEQGLEQGISNSSTPESTPTLPLALPASQSPVGTALKLQPLNLVELLHPLLVAHQALADERQQLLTTSIPVVPSTRNLLPEVMADPQALREVVGNLLDNALKYTPAGGQIHVSLCRQTDNTQPNQPVIHQQVIHISDTGPGIPTSDLPQLFQRHYRGIQAASSIPGTGLGLAIARELMQQMQGHLDVVSPALWQPDPPGTSTGSTFILKLPEVVAKTAH
jgi:signal transduction histidine kinase